MASIDMLSSFLAQNLDRSTEPDKIAWFVDLLKWIQRPRTLDEKDLKKESVYTSRIKYLLFLLKKNPEWSKHFVRQITFIALKVSATSQYISVGLSTHTSFIQEFLHRLQNKFLPGLPMSEDLYSLINEVFDDPDESVLIDCIDPVVLGELLNLFSDEAELKYKVKTDILAACYIISVQLLNSAFLIQSELNRIHQPADKLPEFKLEGTLRRHQIDRDFLIPQEVTDVILQITDHVEHLQSLMAEQGVKIELVYLIEGQKRRLRRLQILLNFLIPEKDLALGFRLFLSNLVLDISHEKSLRSFISENLSLLTDRIVKSSSHIGEHYLTFTWVEFYKMLGSAMGGGLVTSLTVFLKSAINHLNLAGFIKGFAEGLNYSSSFLLIQMMGWTLATKQPSSTAPFIASALLKSISESRRSMMALLRTQFIAVLGNLSVVFPVCFLISWSALLLKHPVKSQESALEVFNSSNFLGPSTIYAVFTGGLLFAASIIAGWVENWVVINRLESRLKSSPRMIRWLGLPRAEKFGFFVSENANALAANISLGFLLGLTPPFLSFLGIPLETRHVTLATGAFASALPIVVQLNPSWWELLNSILGIFWIGLINISVSFTLAFLLASVSSKAKFSSLLRLLSWSFGLILTKPWLLFVPEKVAKPSPESLENG